MEVPDASNWMKLQILLDCACTALQELFLEKWKAKTGSEWNKSQSEVISKYKLKNVNKTIIKKRNVKEWDISTLRAVLSVRGLLDLSSDQKEGIATIANIRNTINHLPNKRLTQQQFDKWWEKMHSTLIAFGVSETVLEQLKHENRLSGVEVNVAEKEMINDTNTANGTILKNKGNDSFNKGHYTEAIELFTKGIALEGLSFKDRAILHSNRCIAYLKMYESDESHLLRAKEDAELVMALWPDWWRGYFRIGQVYIALGKYTNAEEALNKAFAKEPHKKEIADVLSNARRLRGEEERYEFLNPTTLSTSDFVSKMNEKRGLNMNVDVMKKMEDWNSDCGIPDLENLEYCRKGHRCRYGTDGLPRDYREAVRYYKMAAERGNAEGMYNLAQLLFTGEGVTQDFQEGLKWLEKAAAQPPDHPTVAGLPNIGVAQAQHYLGLCYTEGIGVLKNLSVAKDWYKKAIDNGESYSANNLGLLYENGIIDRKPDLVKAEHYYRLAAKHPIRPDCNAMLNLARLYWKKGDVERALDWCRRAEQNGNKHPLLYSLESIVQNELNDFKQSTVIAWEIENCKSVNGLTVRQRIERYTAAKNEGVHDLIKLANTLATKLRLAKPCCLFSFPTKDFDPCGLKLLSEFESSAKHSVYGHSLWVAKKHCIDAMKIMTLDILDKEIPPITSCETFIKHFSAGVQIEFAVFRWPQLFCEKAISTINYLLKLNLSFDEDVRICYVALQGVQCPETCIPFLDECIQKYPENAHFLKVRASMKAFVGRFESGVCDARAALRLDPGNADYLYDQAGMMKLSNNFKLEDTVEAYKHFLKMAPKDHRKVPESFYGLAECMLRKVSSCANISSKMAKQYLSEAKQFYDRGMAAEENQLKFFLPYDSNTRTMLEVSFPLTAKSYGYTLSLSTKSEPIAKEEGPDFIKPYLTDSDRVFKIRQYRKAAEEFNVITKCAPSTFKPPKDQQLPHSLTNLKPISLDGMDPNIDFVHDGYVLDGIIIDDFFSTGSSICVLIEDRNRCVERCFIYNSPYMVDLTGAREVLGPGCKISLLNPYMRMSADGDSAIRVDDVASIVFGDKISKMCRYCCELDANHLCGRCRNASYCNKNCQTLDWKEMCHKAICRPIVV